MNFDTDLIMPQARGRLLGALGDLCSVAMSKPQKLVHEEDWKRRAVWTDEGYFRLETGDTGEVPVRLFVTQKLLTEAEPTLYRQVVNATRFPGVMLVCVTPDVHYGYGVPVGCVILTDRKEGAVAMGPVGFDIGCGMMSARSASIGAAPSGIGFRSMMRTRAPGPTLRSPTSTSATSRRSRSTSGRTSTRSPRAATTRS
jgi:hypothetical protein